VSVTLEAIELLLATEMALDRWDQPPSLGVLVSRGPNVLVQPIDFDPEFWAMSDVPTVLAMVALALGVDGHPPLPVQLPIPADFAGVAIFTEGWGLDTEGMSRAERDEALAFSNEHGVSKHPRRMECKLVMALDRDRAYYFVQQARGAHEPIWRETETDVGILSGRLIESLTAVLEALEAEVLS
jgi:hypothetical protein